MSEYTKDMQIDHKNYPATLKNKNDFELRDIIIDCQQAIEAMPQGYKAGYYSDEINYCAMELHSRKAKVNVGGLK